MANILYNEAMNHMMVGSMDFDTHSFMYAVMTTGHTPAASHATWGAVSSGQTSGTGYTAGGQLLANGSVTLSQASGYVFFDADNVVFSGSSFTGRYGVIYDITHISNALVCCHDFVTSYTSSAGNFSITFGATGILLMSQP